MVFVCTNLAADEDTTASAIRPVQFLDSLQGKLWATVASEQGGYRLRLLTDQEKNEAEQTVDRYRKSRDEERTAAYRTMPADVRAGRFYKIRRFGAGAIELQGDELHAILPLTSVRVMLLGPKGSLDAGDRLDRGSTGRSSGPSPQKVIQAIRGGGRGSVGGRSGVFSSPSGSVAAGLLGAVAVSSKESDKKPQDSKPSVFFLKYAEAISLIEVIDEVYADIDLRRAIEPRLNAIIVQGEPKVIEQIEQLIEVLDRQTDSGSEEPAEAPTLRTYSIEKADGGTVLQVLQTLLAGQPDVRLSVDINTNRIIVFGRADAHEIVKSAIKELETAK